MGRRTSLTAKRTIPRGQAPTLVPIAPTGETTENRDDILAAMAAALAHERPGSTADALRTLRLAYPRHPLALRLAALAIAMKHVRPDVTFAPPNRIS